MKYFNSVMSFLKERKERAESGKYNCIPWPFPRFREFLPGIEMGKYIIVTANQKVCKTNFCDFLFVYETIFFLIDHPEIKVKVFYFCLEESIRKKFIEFQCHLLYRLDNIIISPTELTSTDKDKPVPEYILNLLESDKYQKYIEKFEEVVEYIDDEKNPTGINKKLREYALSHGHLNFKTIDIKDPITGKPTIKSIVDPVNPYTSDNPEEYRIVIVDNASNLNTENNLNKRETIERLSKYAITLRDQLKYTFVLIQHQAQSQEGIENFKLNKLKPSSDGLSDCKVTTRDFRNT